MRRRRTVEPGTGPHQPLAGRILGTGLHLSYFCRRYTNVRAALCSGRAVTGASGQRFP